MSRHDFQIPVTFKHRIVFTRDAFSPENPNLREILAEGGGAKALVLVDEGVAAACQGWPDRIGRYFENSDVALAGVACLPGGEAVKADDLLVREVWKRIDEAGLDRHSYLVAIGGGAFLDAVGFAAATAHRGVRLVRFPTTSLSQDDSGVGVKCAINAFGKKNWVGSFAVPFAVVNDFSFLHMQEPGARRDGLIEALKVALVKDKGFFEWIEDHVEELAALREDVVEICVERSALLHARHIAEGGDPFETGSSRPLDFGHWVAHKLETLTQHELPHSEAVAIGMALDCLYSEMAGFAPVGFAERVLKLYSIMGFLTHHEALEWRDGNGKRRILAGLDEFREHLGGRLTLLMIREIGTGVDVHKIDTEAYGRCIDQLRGPVPS
jgi:3-dehydroquinate synthase